MRSTESDRSRVLIVFKSQFLFTTKTLFALSWLQNLIQYLLHLVFHTAPWWQYTASTWTCTVFCIFAHVQTFTFESCCISSFELLYQPLLQPPSALAYIWLCQRTFLLYLSIQSASYKNFSTLKCFLCNIYTYSQCDGYTREQLGVQQLVQGYFG